MGKDGSKDTGGKGGRGHRGKGKGKGDKKGGKGKGTKNDDTGKGASLPDGAQDRTAPPSEKEAKPVHKRTDKKRFVIKFRAFAATAVIAEKIHSGLSTSASFLGSRVHIRVAVYNRVSGDASGVRTLCITDGTTVGVRIACITDALACVKLIDFGGTAA